MAQADSSLNRLRRWLGRAKASLLGDMKVILGMFLVFGLFIVYMNALSPTASPASIMTILRAMVDVAGVLVGLSGIMYGNMIMTVSQTIFEARSALDRHFSPLESLQKYRLDLTDSMLGTLSLLISSIASSLLYMTYVPELPLRLPTTQYLSMPLLLLVWGALMMATSLKRPLP